MAKTKIKFDPAKAAGELRQKLNDAIKDEGLVTDVGLFLTDRIRFEARRGKPLNDERSFPELSDASKAIRRANAKLNKTARSFDADKSNLTFTGQLQDALSFERLKKGLFVLFVKASRRSATKSAFDKSASGTNADVDKKLRSGVSSIQFGTRSFNLFTGKGLKSDAKIPKRIRALLLKTLRRQLRRS